MFGSKRNKNAESNVFVSGHRHINPLVFENDGPGASDYAALQRLRERVGKNDPEYKRASYLLSHGGRLQDYDSQPDQFVSSHPQLSPRDIVVRDNRGVHTNFSPRLPDSIVISQSEPTSNHYRTDSIPDDTGTSDHRRPDLIILDDDNAPLLSVYD